MPNTVNYLNQAVADLKALLNTEPDCDMCGDTGEVMEYVYDTDCHNFIPDRTKLCIHCQ